MEPVLNRTFYWEWMHFKGGGGGGGGGNSVEIILIPFWKGFYCKRTGANSFLLTVDPFSEDRKSQTAPKLHTGPRFALSKTEKKTIL